MPYARSRKIPFALAAVLLLLAPCASAQSSSQDADVKSVLAQTSLGLGWPSGTANVEGLPFGAYGYLISGSGKGKDDTNRIWISVFASEKDAMDAMNTLQENGLTRGTYHGKDAIIMSKDDKICNAGGFTGMLLGWARGIASALGSEDASTLCFGSYGTVAWRCGNLMLATQDDSGGAERAQAEALYKNAEAANLCGFGDTIVILAKFSDYGPQDASHTLSYYEDMADEVNDYYNYNGYGKVSFDFTFKDADGAKGSDDWYDVGKTAASYNKQETPYMEDAIRAAFKDTGFKDGTKVDRIVVVFPGNAAQQKPSKSGFSNADAWKDANYAITVADSDGTQKKLYCDDLISMGENRPVGTWVHEFGHTLWWKIKTDNKYYKINDRYDYGQAWGHYGEIGPWGLMGSGSHNGPLDGDAPSQMCGFTKEAAGWLRYRDAKVGQEYTLTSLEDMKSGDFLLRLDDPSSTDAMDFYVIEARKAAGSSGAYLAPASGVVIYKAGHQPHSGYNYETLNNIAPQNGTKKLSSPGVPWGPFDAPTLHGASSANGSVLYVNPDHGFQVLLTGEKTDNGKYTASVKVEPYVSAELKGFVLKMKGMLLRLGTIPGENGNLPENTADPLVPDLDLHAYDGQGRHTGMDYSTGEYENGIPGAMASGDLVDDGEWIYVPSGTQVRYEVSAYDAEAFLERYPQFESYASDMSYSGAYVKFDSSGARTEAAVPERKISAGAESEAGGPDDSGLSYVPVQQPGFGNNGGGACCLPALALPGILAFAFMGRR